MTGQFNSYYTFQATQIWLTNATGRHSCALSSIIATLTELQQKRQHTSLLLFSLPYVSQGDLLKIAFYKSALKGLPVEHLMNAIKASMSKIAALRFTVQQNEAHLCLGIGKEQQTLPKQSECIVLQISNSNISYLFCIKCFLSF